MATIMKKPTTTTVVRSTSSASSSRCSSMSSTCSGIASVPFELDEKSYLLPVLEDEDEQTAAPSEQSVTVAARKPSTLDRMRNLRRQRRLSKQEKKTLSKKTSDDGFAKETLDADDDSDDSDDEEYDVERADSQPAWAWGSSTSLSSSFKGSSANASTKKEAVGAQRIRAYWARRAAVLLATKLLWPFLRKGGENTVIVPLTHGSLRIKRTAAPNLDEAQAILLVGGTTPVPVPEVVCAFVHRRKEAYTVLRHVPGCSADVVWDQLSSHHREWIRCRVAEMLAYLHAMEVPEGTPAAEELRGRCGGEMPRVVFAHGNFTLGNVILDPIDGRVASLVDWERAGWFAAGWDVKEREFAELCCARKVAEGEESEDEEDGEDEDLVVFKQ